MEIPPTGHESEFRDPQDPLIPVVPSHLESDSQFMTSASKLPAVARGQYAILWEQVEQCRANAEATREDESREALQQAKDDMLDFETAFTPGGAWHEPSLVAMASVSTGTLDESHLFLLVQETRAWESFYGAYSEDNAVTGDHPLYVKFTEARAKRNMYEQVKSGLNYPPEHT